MVSVPPGSRLQALQARAFRPAAVQQRLEPKALPAVQMAQVQQDAGRSAVPGERSAA